MLPTHSRFVSPYSRYILVRSIFHNMLITLTLNCLHRRYGGSKKSVSAVVKGRKDLSRYSVPQRRRDARAAMSVPPRPSSLQLWLMLRKYPDASIGQLTEDVGDEQDWSGPVRRNARRRINAVELARQQTLAEIMQLAPPVSDVSPGAAVRFTTRVMEMIQNESARQLDPFDV